MTYILDILTDRYKIIMEKEHSSIGLFNFAGTH